MLHRSCLIFANVSGSAFLLLGLLAASPAQAQIVNGNFGTGNFTGWTLDGNNVIQTAAIGSGPTGGNTFQALIQNNDSRAYSAGGNSVPAGTADNNYVSFESFVGVSDSAFTNLIPRPASGEAQYLDTGSAIKQVVTLKKGDKIAFDYNFLANGDAAGFNGPPYRPYPHTTDAAFVHITDGAADTLSLLGDTTTSIFAGSLTPITNPYLYQTATNNGQTYATYSFLAPEDGSYTITLGAVGANNIQMRDPTSSNQAFGPVGLLADNFTVMPASAPSVPEPGSAALFIGMSLSCAGFFAHRKYGHQATKMSHSATST